MDNPFLAGASKRTSFILTKSKTETAPYMGLKDMNFAFF